MSRPVWLSDVERDAWMEKNCARCFQRDEAWKRVAGVGDGCPLLLRAAKGKKPTQWTLRRNAVMGETYRCSDYIDKPPTTRRKSAPADTATLWEKIND